MLEPANWRGFEGWATSRGILEVMELPLGQLCNLIWYWIGQNAEDPNELHMLEIKLWMPPPGRQPRGMWSAEGEMAAFRALKSQVKK